MTKPEAVMAVHKHTLMVTANGHADPLVEPAWGLLHTEFRREMIFS
jgi:hypothetical protein